jgi:hypothetical protein
MDAFADSTHQFTALQLATIQGHQSSVELVIKLGAKVGVTDKAGGQTPLHHAARLGFIEIATTLLNKDANRSATDLQGTTPEFLALKNNNWELAQLVARHTTGKTGDTPGCDPFLPNPEPTIKTGHYQPASGDSSHPKNILNGDITFYAVDLGLCRSEVRNALESYQDVRLICLGKPVILKLNTADETGRSVPESPKPKPPRTECYGLDTNLKAAPMSEAAPASSSSRTFNNSTQATSSLEVPTENQQQDNLEGDSGQGADSSALPILVRDEGSISKISSETKL